MCVCGETAVSRLLGHQLVVVVRVLEGIEWISAFFVLVRTIVAELPSPAGTEQIPLAECDCNVPLATDRVGVPEVLLSERLELTVEIVDVPASVGL